MKKVIMYIHTHWDREWYREFEEFRLRLIEVTDEILERLQSGDLPEFYFDGQTIALEDYLEIYPEKEELVKSLIKQKKLFVGPFCCSADQFLTNGESLLRNLYFGIKKSREWGEKDFIAYLSDTFGHCVSMNEILKTANLDKAVIWRGIGDLPADLTWNDIKTTNLIQGYFNDFLNCDIDFDTKSDLLKKYLDKIAAKSGEYVLLPIGGDHLKACDDIKNLICKLNKKFKDEYQFILSNPIEYFKKIKDEDRTSVKGEFLNNDKTFILQGVYSARNDIKQANAVCERKLNEAEMFDAINSTFFCKKSRQKQIDYAYKTLIKNHAHDSIYGCSTDKVSREVLTRFEKVEEIADGIKKRCIRDISTPDGIVAINLSNSEFSGITTIKTTKKLPSSLNAVKIGKERGFSDELLYNPNKIPVTEDYTDIIEYAVNLKNIPEFSSKTITKNDIFDKNDIKISKNSIENENIKIKINGNKIVVTDKKNQKIYGDFMKFSDVADIGDSYNFAPLKDDKKIVSKIKSFKIEDKKFLAILKIVFEIKIPEKTTDKRRSIVSPKHEIEARFVLGSGAKFVKIDLKYENKSKDHKLQAVFDLEKPVNETISEDLYKTVKRNFDPNYDLNEKIPAPRGIELKQNTMPINRFVWTNGVGIITDGLKEIEIAKNTLAVTILRATGIISNPKNPARGTPAGPPLVEEDLQMIGKQKASFAFSFTDKAENLYKICDEIFNPPILLFGNMKNRQFISKDNKAIRVTAIRKSAENDLIVRLVNYSNEKEICTINSKQVFETDLTELKSIPTHKILYFNPHEIKTIKL